MTMLLLFITIAAAQPTAHPVPTYSSEVTQEVDPARMSLARQLVRILHTDRLIDDMFTRIAPIYAKNFVSQVQSDPTLTIGVNKITGDPAGGAQKISNIFNEEDLKELRQHMPEILDAYAAQYALGFSQSDLKQLISFYSSELGSRFLDASPAIEAGAITKIHDVGLSAGMEAAKRTIERAKREASGESQEPKP